MIKALKLIERRNQIEAENRLVTCQAINYTLDIDLTPKSIGELPFTQLETDYLLKIVPTNMKLHANQISWEGVSRDWMLRYQADVQAGKLDRLNCRNRATLKMQYQTITRKYKENKKRKLIEPLADNIIPLPISEDSNSISDQVSAIHGGGCGARWKRDATKHFNELYSQYDCNFNYQVFLKLWPCEYGAVSHQQFKNKINYLRHHHNNNNKKVKKK